MHGPYVMPRIHIDMQKMIISLPDEKLGQLNSMLTLLEHNKGVH